VREEDSTYEYGPKIDKQKETQEQPSMEREQESEEMVRYGETKCVHRMGCMGCERGRCCGKYVNPQETRESTPQTDEFMMRLVEGIV